MKISIFLILQVFSKDPFGMFISVIPSYNICFIILMKLSYGSKYV